MARSIAALRGVIHRSNVTSQEHVTPSRVTFGVNSPVAAVGPKIDILHLELRCLSGHQPVSEQAENQAVSRPDVGGQQAPIQPAVARSYPRARPTRGQRAEAD